MADETKSTFDTELIRSARFRKEREPDWRKLETLLHKAETMDLSALSYQEAMDLSSHYRQAMNSLSVARSISLDKALLAYLEQLCARAYMVIYAPQESLAGSVSKLFIKGIPQAARRTSKAMFIGFLAMLLGALMGYVLIGQDPSWYFSFVPQDLADGRTPAASEAYLRSTLFDAEEHAGNRLAEFATMLFTHNTRIAILIFALGVFAALPSFLLTFSNGLMLGAFVRVFTDAGLGYEIAGWLSIHGVTEIAAICIACAGGAHLGLAVLLPGNRTRRDALRENGRDAVKLAILAGIMLIVAALVEGFWRQTVQSTELRLAIGWGLGLAWFCWLAFSGREREQS